MQKVKMWEVLIVAGWTISNGGNADKPNKRNISINLENDEIFDNVNKQASQVVNL